MSVFWNTLAKLLFFFCMTAGRAFTLGKILFSWLLWPFLPKTCIRVSRMQECLNPLKYEDVAGEKKLPMTPTGATRLGDKAQGLGLWMMEAFHHPSLERDGWENTCLGRAVGQEPFSATLVGCAVPLWSMGIRTGWTMAGKSLLARQFTVPPQLSWVKMKHVPRGHSLAYLVNYYTGMCYSQLHIT